MNEARVYAVKYRISEALLSEDGPTVDQLASFAEARAALLADGIRVFVADRVAVLATWTEQSEESLFAGCQTIAASAMEIVEVAEAAGLDAVGAVARGICVMLDGLARQGMWHTDALRVHLLALNLVHGQSSQPGSASQTVVQELRSLRSSIGFTD